MSLVHSAYGVAFDGCSACKSESSQDPRLAQVIAYTQVTPDHFPAKIYVEETADALRNLTAPFQHAPALRSNCSDLLHSMAAAGKVGGAGWQPSAADVAAVESCLGEVSTADTSSTTAALSSAAVKLLQAFIDSNGCASAAFCALHVLP